MEVILLCIHVSVCLHKFFLSTSRHCYWTTKRHCTPEHVTPQPCAGRWAGVWWSRGVDRAFSNSGLRLRVGSCFTEHVMSSTLWLMGYKRTVLSLVASSWWERPEHQAKSMWALECSYLFFTACLHWEMSTWACKTRKSLDPLFDPPNLYGKARNTCVNC